MTALTNATAIYPSLGGRSLWRRRSASRVRRSQFNQRRTAQALGLTYHQLRHHLKKHGMLGAR
jgi:transcriptional regulator with AAA-type ATPase domain